VNIGPNHRYPPLSSVFIFSSVFRITDKGGLLTYVRTRVMSNDKIADRTRSMFYNSLLSRR